MAESKAIKKVLIDNRGEIALRILRTCRELGVGAVVAYSSRDADSLAVREARVAGDDYGAVLVGGASADQSYEDIAGVIAAAQAFGCDAVHPGYGFLSENADAAQAIADAGLIFIGPDSDVIRHVGNKSAARALAERAKVPVMPASPLIHRFAEAEKYSKTIGYPFVLKADVGGGGMNNLFVLDEPTFKDTFENFSLRNPGGFYLERKLDHARHIELQVAADTHGAIVVLGERDCTAQRKAQKVIEEAPATIVPEKILSKIRNDAITMAKLAGYTGVGTWEFLFDPANNAYYFMEINPRIQVEHTVTEATYDGLDIVAWQLAIANGLALPVLPKRRDVHVIQLRLYAEDPRHDFRQSPGTLTFLRLPAQSPSLRIDRGYDEGDTVPAGFDATIAKFIVSAPNREKARLKALETLERSVIGGVHTNRDFLRWLLATPEFIENSLWTTFIEPAWQSEQTRRFADIGRFIGEGTFDEHDKPSVFDATTYVQDLTYERRGVARRYSEDLARQHDKNPDSCGFRFGIYKDTAGTEFALGFWDFSVMGGTLGSEEGAAVAEMFKLAYQKKLSVVTITTSSGARQQEGAKALEMMDVIVSARWQYRPPLYINIYSGLNFGGVTVSLAESADVSYAVTGSKIGFAGPDLVARMMGKKSGAELPIGAHSAEDAVDARTVDVLVSDLAEARMRINHLLEAMDGASSDAPSSALYETAVDTTRYDRPASERFATLAGELYDRLLDSPADPQLSDTPLQKRRLLADPARPTAADFLNPSLGLFDTTAPLSIRTIKETTEQYAPIIGAIARLDNQNVMVLGQQTQRRRSDDGTIEKVYVAPRARDLRWALRMIRVAEHLRTPILLITDTTGGDASLFEEADGVSRAIADILSVMHEEGAVTVPVLSVIIGENGSGGGLTFGRPLDASADLENALTFVATPDAQVKILTDTWPQSDDDAAAIINQLRDASSEGRLELGQIDAVITEPAGGAHMDPAATARSIRAFISEQLAVLTKLSVTELTARRFARIERAGNYGLKPYQKTSK